MQIDQERLDRLVEERVKRGAASYVRRRVLPRIFDTLTVEALHDESEAGTAAIVTRLGMALRAEQMRIARGHWTASAPRCMAIRQALHAEREALAAMQARAAA